MMLMLANRKVMVTVAFVVIAAMVVTMAVGLLNSANAPERPEEPPPPAPDMGVLGAEPNRISYVDLGEQCDPFECFRVVGLASEDLDSAEAVDAVYTTLLERGFGRLLPPDEDDPEAVAWEDSTLFDGQVLIQGSQQPVAEGTVAHLVLVHADSREPPA